MTHYGHTVVPPLTNSQILAAADTACTDRTANAAQRLEALLAAAQLHDRLKGAPYTRRENGKEAVITEHYSPHKAMAYLTTAHKVARQHHAVGAAQVMCYLSALGVREADLSKTRELADAALGQLRLIERQYSDDPTAWKTLDSAVSWARGVIHRALQRQSYASEE